MQQRESVTSLSFTSRLLLVGASAAGTALLVVAWSLEPDARGWGTHEQLGLMPCFFRQQLGHLCPTCGMTTAWAHTVRGNFAHATLASLAGTMLCLAVGLAVPWMSLSAIRGRWFIGSPNASVWIVLLLIWVGVAIMDWLRRGLTY